MSKRINISFFTVLILVTCIFKNVPGQPNTLDKCIEYALEHNTEIVNQGIRTDMAHTDYQQARRDLLPSVYSGAGSNMFFGKSIDPTTNDFVEQRLFSGNLYVSAEVDLFQGLVKQNRIKFEKINHQITREEGKKLRMDIAFQTMEAYFDVVYYRELLKIAYNQAELSKMNLKKSKKLVETGLKAHADLLQMEAQLAAEQHNVLVVQNQLEQAHLQLKQIMRFPLRDTLNIDYETDTEVPEIIPTADEVYQNALTHIPEISKAEMNIRAHQKQMRIDQGKLLPQLLLGAGFSTNYADSRKELQFPNDPDNDAMQTIALSNQLKQNASQNIYLSLRIPIFQKWNRVSTIQKDRMELQIARNEKVIAKNKLLEQVISDIQLLKARNAQIAQLEKQLAAEKAAYQAVEKKLAKGLVSVIEYNTVKNNMAKAAANLLRTQLLQKINFQTLAFYQGKRSF